MFVLLELYCCIIIDQPGAGCSKLTMSLVNVSNVNITNTLLFFVGKM